MEPWPLDSTKRSRSGQCGSAGLWRRWWFHSASAISAIPMGMPGWPDFDFATASTASMRKALARVRRSLVAFAAFSTISVSVIAFPPSAHLFVRVFSMSLFLTVHQLPDQRRDDELHGERHLAAGADDGV